MSMSEDMLRRMQSDNARLRQTETKEVPVAGGSIIMQEVDGTPSGAVTTFVLPNGTLSIIGTTATYTPATPTITIKEVDGSPSGAVNTLELPNGTLSIVGATATYTPAVAPSGPSLGLVAAFHMNLVGN